MITWIVIAMFGQELDPNTIVILASAGAAILLGYVCYIAAYVQHKKEKNRQSLTASAYGETMPSYETAKTETWFKGYYLALVVQVAIATFGGWFAVQVVGSEFALSALSEPTVAAIGAIVVGLVADRYVIHPIADGVFFEKVEKPLVEEFLRPIEDAPIEDPSDKVGQLALVLQQILEKR